MFRKATEPVRGPAFSCSLDEWELLRELGQTFGWRPKGVTYVAPPGRKIVAPAQRNYQPGEWLDRKWVDADDARAWGQALHLARQSSHMEAMITARCAGAGEDVGRRRHDHLLSVVDTFAEFTGAGAFEFAVAAPADSAGEDIRSPPEQPPAGMRDS
jgi:hypothetical protein